MMHFRSILLSFSLLIIVILLMGKQASGSSGALQQDKVLPPGMDMALTRAFGRYQGLVSAEELIDDLRSADIVYLGEAHFERRDMETAFELLRRIAGADRQVVLAVERFPADLQPQLDRLAGLESTVDKNARLDEIFQSEGYHRVWGEIPKDRSGYPVNTPSIASFEAMVRWAVEEEIPILALDAPLAQRSKSASDFAARNIFWHKRVMAFLERYPTPPPLIVMVGGIDHASRAADSVVSLLQDESGLERVVSVGQRDGMYRDASLLQVGHLASQMDMDTLIVEQPEFALSNGGSPRFPFPPEYWIVVFQTP